MKHSSSKKGKKLGTC